MISTYQIILEWTFSYIYKYIEKKTEVDTARKTINNPEVHRESPIFHLWTSVTNSSQNRYQFPGEKNCCQRSTNDEEKDEQRFKKSIKKKMKNAFRRQEHLTTNHHVS